MLLDILGGTSQLRYISVLTVLSIFLLVCFLKRGRYNNEGFSQENPFVLREGDDIFDQFYAEINNTIHKHNIYVDYISESVIKHTNPKTLLVIASDTGEQCDSFHKKNVDTVSLFKHKKMFEHSKNKYPELRACVGNTENPMTFDKSRFSHIFCTGHTIYTIKNKTSFFKIIHNWLQPDGIFLLQLSERNLFDTCMTTKLYSSDESPQKYHDQRITESVIDYGSFKYTSKYNFDDAETENIVHFSETFVDKYSQHVRKNEHIMFMEKTEEIIETLILCKFSIRRRINIPHDANQFIYILERKH